LYKKHKMRNNLLKIRHIRLRDILREKHKVLMTSLKKNPNKLRKNLAKLSKNLLQEKKISNNLPVKN